MNRYENMELEVTTRGLSHLRLQAPAGQAVKRGDTSSCVDGHRGRLRESWGGQGWETPGD